MNWVGSKKLALIPLHRSDADPPDLVPADWSNQILARVFLFPDPAGYVVARLYSRHVVRAGGY